MECIGSVAVFPLSPAAGPMSTERPRGITLDGADNSGQSVIWLCDRCGDTGLGGNSASEAYEAARRHLLQSHNEWRVGKRQTRCAERGCDQPRGDHARCAKHYVGPRYDFVQNWAA